MLLDKFLKSVHLQDLNLQALLVKVSFQVLRYIVIN